jgi:hypothetical protein
VVEVRRRCLFSDHFTVSFRQLATGALSEFTDFAYEHILRGWGEEALGRVEAAAFVAAFL